MFMREVVGQQVATKLVIDVLLRARCKTTDARRCIVVICHRNAAATAALCRRSVSA
jgi:hypothetical protein